mgnify:CR=1 FL=1
MVSIAYVIMSAVIGAVVGATVVVAISVLLIDRKERRGYEDERKKGNHRRPMDPQG